MRNTHLYSGLILVAFALTMLVWVIPTQTSPPTSSSELSPDFLPVITMSLVGLLSLILFVKNVFPPADLHETTVDDEEFGDDMTGIKKLELYEITQYFFVVAGYISIVNYLGFIAASVILIALMSVYLGQRVIWQIVLISFATPFFLDWIIWTLFSIQMPTFF